MLKELTITNFRLFKSLHISGLKRVNLFAGKNNTGKTFLLEALRIWAAQGDTTVVNHALALRNEFVQGRAESYDALFNRKALASSSAKTNLSLKINQVEIRRTLSVQSDNVHYKLTWDGTPTKSNPDHRIPPDVPRDAVIFVPFSPAFPLVELWDHIVLTPLEDDVMDIIRQTVLPDLVRLDVNAARTLVRVESSPKPLPLKNFGDGVERMLILAVALVAAKDKLLLIDELEAGLHHSVLEVWWDRLFYYAQQWNIQVFATTHSHDALKAFTYVLERPENLDQGAFFRLQANRATGNIEVVSYPLEDLELSIESNLEPR